MRKSIPERSKSEDQLFALEEHLAGALKPITPPQELVARLRQHIVLRLGNWKRLFLVYGGVMSGLLVTITIARALFYFVSRR
jgi:hypothetical protein